MTALFDSIHLGKMTLPNRLVMAPMTRTRATEEGLATPLMAEYYAQRAGAGLIITEGTQPCAIGQGYFGTPGLYTEAQVEAWRQVTDAVHDAGGRIVVQLMHVGRMGHPKFTTDGRRPVAPSPVRATANMATPIALPEMVEPLELSQADIDSAIVDFVSAARNAIMAGFDGVELHGGHGYLIHQFLADNTNIRTDAYGGSTAGHVRFAREVTEAVADAIGPERTGLRLTPGVPSNDIVETDTRGLYTTLVEELPEIAFLEVAEYAGPQVNRDLIRELRELWPGAFILNPHLPRDPASNLPYFEPVTADIAEAAVASGVADAVSFGVGFLANPDLPERIRTGSPANDPDRATFYGRDSRGYTDYPVQ